MQTAALLERLELSSAEPDPRRRRLIALAILTERLRQDNITPILVGGGAVEFYTAGGYATTDIDLALPACEEVNVAFADLGFEKVGRYWVREDLDLLFEAPALAGLPGEDAPRTVVEIDGMTATIIGVDDLIMDRLRAWVHWQSTEDERWTKRLAQLYKDQIDWEYLRSRSMSIPQELEAIQELFDETRQ